VVQVAEQRQRLHRLAQTLCAWGTERAEPEARSASKLCQEQEREHAPFRLRECSCGPRATWWRAS
jgi:hypothetical protein